MSIYRGEYVRPNSPGSPSQMVAENFNAIYNRDLHDGDWTVVDLESISSGVCARRATEIGESFCLIRQACREAFEEVRQNLLLMLPSLTMEASATPSSPIAPRLDRLKVQLSGLYEEDGRSR